MANNSFKQIPSQLSEPSEEELPKGNAFTYHLSNLLSKIDQNLGKALIGVGLVVLVIFLGISFVSFIYTGQIDQSYVEGFLSEQEDSQSAQNWLGGFGAIVSYFFIQRWFGIGSFLILVVLATGAMTIFGKMTSEKWKRLSLLLLFSTLAMSILLGYLVFVTEMQSSWAFLCGGVGYAISEVLGRVLTPLVWVALVGGFGYFYSKDRLNLEFYGSFAEKYEPEEKQEEKAIVSSAEVSPYQEVSPAKEAPLSLKEEIALAKNNSKSKNSPAAIPAPHPEDERLVRPANAHPKQAKPSLFKSLFGGNKKKTEQNIGQAERPEEQESKQNKIVSPVSRKNAPKIKDDLKRNLPKKELPKQKVQPIIPDENLVETEQPKTSNAVKSKENNEIPQKEQSTVDASEEEYFIPTAKDFGLTEYESEQESAPEKVPENKEKPEKETLLNQSDREIDLELPPVRPSVDRVKELYDEPVEEILEDEEKDVQDIRMYNPKDELPKYESPSVELLDNPVVKKQQIDKEELTETKMRIEQTLKNFKIDIKRIHAEVGPTVTLYEIVPAAGVKIAQIRNLGDDIALNLAALGIRIIAPMPGKGTIGIEVPNKEREIVPLRTLLEHDTFKHSRKDLPLVLGKDISNQIFIADLTKMPHLLIGGATGQGKSVGINVILTSLLYKKHPSELKFVMIDPKKVEFSLFAKLEKHYLAHLPNAEPIVTDSALAVQTLEALCREMDERYDLLKDADCRNVKEYNQKFKTHQLEGEQHRFLPYIVLVIDELADLMIIAGKAAEKPIARLAQMARAIGIHLVVATQRPSVNVVTGIIKANFPARMAFRVTSKIDSRIILDTSGAEQLIGQGDMLLSNGSDILRLQCAFVDTPEVERICKHIQEQKGFAKAYPLPEELNFDVEDDEMLPGDELF